MAKVHRMYTLSREERRCFGLTESSEAAAGGRRTPQNGRMRILQSDGADLVGDQLEEYRTKGALVCSYSFSKRCVCACPYTDNRGDAMSVRLHPAGVPMPEKLLLPEVRSL